MFKDFLLGRFFGWSRLFEFITPPLYYVCGVCSITSLFVADANVITSVAAALLARFQYHVTSAKFLGYDVARFSLTAKGDDGDGFETMSYGNSVAEVGFMWTDSNDDIGGMAPPRVGTTVAGWSQGFADGDGKSGLMSQPSYVLPCCMMHIHVFVMTHVN